MQSYIKKTADDVLKSDVCQQFEKTGRSQLGDNCPSRHLNQPLGPAIARLMFVTHNSYQEAIAAVETATQLPIETIFVLNSKSHGAYETGLAVLFDV